MGVAGVRGLAIAAAATLLAIASAVVAYSDWIGGQYPDTALSLGLRTPAALSAVADRSLVDFKRPGHMDDARAEATAALAAAPLDVRAVRVLALVAESDGDPNRAEALMRLADARSRRDDLTELWLFEDDALLHDFPAAAAAADAVLLHNDRLQNVLFPGMAAILVNPAAVGPLGQRLAEKPAWRGPFLSFLASRADDPAVVAGLFQALAASPAPPTDTESSAIVLRLVTTGDLAGARALWLRLLPAGARTPGNGVYDGDFAGAPGAAPFNWLFPPSNGAVAEEGPGNDGHPSLYVRSPADSPHLLAVQLLMLPPGAWRLTGAVRIEPGLSGPVFAWRIACLPDSELATATIAAEPAGWRAFSADVRIPPGCPAQKLHLVGLAHAGFEPAEAYWRGIAIQPTPAAAPAPGPTAAGPTAARAN